MQEFNVQISFIEGKVKLEVCAQHYILNSINVSMC